MKKYTQQEIDTLIVVTGGTTYIHKQDFIVSENGIRYIKNQDFSNCDLSGLNLERVVFKNVNLQYVNLQDANLQHTDLEGVNLRHTSLCNANLQGANLNYVIGNCREIKSMQLDKWHITYTNEIMAIGCEQHTIEQWWNFTDDEIEDMSLDALDWWEKWKTILFNIINIDKKSFYIINIDKESSK